MAIKHFCDVCPAEIKEPNFAIVQFQEQKIIWDEKHQKQQGIEKRELLLCGACKKSLEEYIIKEQNKIKK